MKKLILSIIFLFIALIAVVLVNTFTYQSRQSKISPVKEIFIKGEAIQNLSESVRIKTISYDEAEKFDSIPFINFLNFLEKKFPVCDSLLKKEIINKYSALYKWEGKNPSLKPVILLAHIDVVPAEGKWTEVPFSGLIKDEYIWGRGTLDDKVSILGIMEAAEKLLQEGFMPERTIYFAFGHDEEVMGNKGAKQIAALLKSRNIQAEFILDEGLVITHGIVPGIEKPVALIGTAEKGYASFKLSVSLEGGHSSMPQEETAIGVLSSAVAKIEREKLKPEITEPVKKFLDYVGPEMPFTKRIVFANQWLFKSFVIKAYEKSASGNALIRTVVTPTVIKGGLKENVIPDYAEAVINCRTLPGNSAESILKFLRETVNDERINFQLLNLIEPSPVAGTETQGYASIEKTIRQIFPDALVAPSLVLAGTDSKHYVEISKNIYRFLPIRLMKEDLGRIHGANERIKTEDYKDVIRFYYQLIKNL
jgi:carboxypeptidase PM20D1